MTHHLRRMVSAVLVCAVGWFATAAGQEPAAQRTLHVPEEVIVQFRPQAARVRRDAIVAARGARVVRRLETLGITRVRLAPGAGLDAEIAALQNDPDVAAVQPNFIREVTIVPNDPYWASNSLWGLLKIQAPSAWLLSTGNSQVVVANIDTGVDYNHPDLAQNMWRNPGEIAGNGIDDDGNGYVDDVYGIDTENGDTDPMDDHGHGTHTAGTIGAVGNNGVGVAGVNWNVKILPCKFIGAGGTGTDWGAIECFNYITALKKKGVNVLVSSNSWGNPRSTSDPFPQAMKNAIDAAGAAGILNVFAAGNASGNNDSTPFDPASFTSSSIVSVAASDSADKRASFSNYGVSSVDLAAPGMSILSTTKGGGYGSMSGTSMAAPHVAGAAALLSAVKPGATVSAIKTLLSSSVDLLSAWNGIVASGGRLNVYIAALDAGGDIPPTVSLTSPANGSTFTAPATTTVVASASDADGTVTKVDFYANGVLIGSDTTSPYSVSWASVPAGSYNLSAVATDDRMFTTTSALVAVTVNAPISGISRVNVALAANGGVATASSSYGAGYAPSTLINGDRKGSPWGNGGGWSEATPGVYPDWVRIDFAGSKTIDEIGVFMVQDAFTAPIEPSLTMLFSRYGLTNFQVEYWTGTAWAPIPGGTATGNRNVWRQFIFAPVTTTAIRVFITGTIDGWSRLTEIEVYSGDTATPPPPPPPSPTRINVALTSNGGVATASSSYGVGYAPSTLINGDRKGSPWGNGGGWSEATPGVYPDWVRIDFAGSKTIDEIGVFMVQDAFTAPIEPSLTMLFSRYGLTNFRVEYWTGTAWAPIPGGTATENRNVWRQFIFAPVTTTAIRVFITGTIDGWSRLVEVEAYSAGDPPPPPPPADRINVALASNGSVATASSSYSVAYAPSTVVNGDRKGSPWGKGGGWSENTPGVYPDWVRVDFAGSKTIDEVDVFSVQDNFMAPVEPTPTMMFSRYGLTNFQLEYWTGTTWAPLPGGIVSGNRNVWRQFTFASVTTTAIRVSITGTMDGWSRMTELEVYTSGTSAPPAAALIGFPADNWWNLDISNAPVDANSPSYISFINNGLTRRLHPDFGGNVSPGSVEIYGMPYVVVDSTVPKKAVRFYYSSESDGVDHATNQSFPFYPIPDTAITQAHMIEGGQPGNVDRRTYNDRHLLIVDRDNRHLYELWNVFYDGTTWHAGSGAFFDMKTNNRRTEGWTSADAAGLAILPGLVRYDEAFGTEEIRHAFRVTVRATNGYVYPASHRAGSTVGALPMGARLRLKASKDLSVFPAELQRIFRAMKRYGLIVADNGSDMFISGAYDARWNNDILNPAFRALTASDFEVIALGHK